MTTFTCHLCDLPVKAREAVIRSVNFEQVGWHRHCAEAKGFVPVGWEVQARAVAS